jgi:F0F1-type ATP synthase assembly protein I
VTALGESSEYKEQRELKEARMNNGESGKSSNSLSQRYTAGIGAKYQGAMEAVLAIPVGAGFGYLADRQWESAPVGLLIGFAIGFGAFILRLVRMRPPADGDSDPTNTSDNKSER